VTDEVILELNLDGSSPPKCKRCGREKGSHKAITLNCPIGRGNFPSFAMAKVYEARTPRNKPAKAA
jgi:hypothetical protein